MRHYCRPLCGWALALAIAQRLCHANGERSVTISTTHPRQQPTRKSRPTSPTAFAVPPPSYFATPAAAASAASTAGERHTDGRVGVAVAAEREIVRGVYRSGRHRPCGVGGVSCLKAKKSQMKAEEDEFRHDKFFSVFFKGMWGTGFVLPLVVLLLLWLLPLLHVVIGSLFVTAVPSLFSQKRVCYTCVYFCRVRTNSAA